MKKILLLGSGELGKEFVIAAKRAGQYVIACDRYKGAPAMQVADEHEVFNMLDGDALTAVVERHHPDIIVPEIEAIRTERLFDFEKEGIQVVPSARAVNYTMNRKAIRDLAAKELGLRTAKYFYATTLEQLREHSKEIGFPCVIKPLMSSSGHGQSIVRKPEDLEKAFNDAMEGSRGDVKEIIIEEFIHFDSEFTLLTVTQKDGPTLFCPPIGHVQKGGDYRESWQPFQLPEDELRKAEDMAEKVTRALTGAGLWGVEFFLTKQGEVSSLNFRHVRTILVWLHLVIPPTSPNLSYISVPLWDCLLLVYILSMLVQVQLYSRLQKSTTLCHTILLMH